MTLSVGLAIAFVLALTALNALFTLAETAFVTVRQAHLQQLLDDANSRSVSLVQRIIQDPSRVFATVQVGITLSSFTAAALAVGVLAPQVCLTLANSRVPVTSAEAVVIMTMVTALINITLGALVPRSLAQRHPESVAVAVAFLLDLFMKMLAIPATFALWLSNVIVRPFGLTATFAAPLITEEELRTLLEASAKSGAIEEEEKEIIRNVISFGDTNVREVMTPRIDIKAVEVGMGLSTLLDLIIESGHSRIPVYDGSVDTIVGIVNAKDLLAPLGRGETTIDLRAVARHPLFVSENKRVDALLEEFRRSNLQMAIVQDEYGGTAGLVTVEDLLEEIVGEIADEYDSEEPMVRVIDQDSALLDGRVNIDDVNEQMGTDFPHEDYDTIGGLVFGLFGRLPEVGEKVVDHGVELTVENTDGRGVRLVRIGRAPVLETEQVNKPAQEP